MSGAERDVLLIARQKLRGTLQEHEYFPDDNEQTETPPPDEQAIALQKLAQAITDMANRQPDPVIVDTSPIAEAISGMNTQKKRKWEFDVVLHENGRLKKIIATEV